MTPIKLKLKPGEHQLVYVVADTAAVSVKRGDGTVAIVVLSRGEWEVALAHEGYQGAQIHVSKAIV